ncbi:MAG: 3-deoxy-manno-octulosonate cytidylyltransferase [Chlamydiae bacterium]|nr:3-deoxy-manno-octulosonate cytidylyltransferase [Chlamydiota bacterium]
MEKKVVIIIQARMQSIRLPGKVMLKALDRPLLSYLVERLKKVHNAQDIVIATTLDPEDKAILEFAKTEGVSAYCGSTEDVLKRYLLAAQEHSTDVVVRITGDCPLIDPQVVEKVIQYFLDHDFDYVGNTLTLTYPRGMDTEVFSIKTLEDAVQNAKEKSEREHVTLFMYRHPERFRLANVSYSKNVSKYRLTLDTEEDYTLIKSILEALYPKKPNFTLEDMLRYLEENPKLSDINAHVKQKPILKENVNP